MAENGIVTSSEIMEIVTKSIIKQLNDNELLNQTHMRNIYIRSEFHRLVNDEKKTITSAIDILTKRIYLCKSGDKQILSKRSIEKIVWQKNEE